MDGYFGNSKGVHVYWSDKRTVKTKCNVYYDRTGSSVSHLKGEEWDEFVKKKINDPSLPLSMDKPLITSDQLKIPATSNPTDSRHPFNCSKHIDQSRTARHPFDRSNPIENPSDNKGSQSEEEIHPKQM